MFDEGTPRSRSFYVLGAVFVLFVAFLYGPMLVIFVLSFQGPQGGMTFPMEGVSLTWFHALAAASGRVGDIPHALGRSLRLSAIVSVLTLAICLSAGLAFRRRFTGAGLVFYSAVASLVMPSLLVGFGIALGFRLLGWQTNWFTSGVGAQLTWTLPFGMFLMFVTIGRFDRRLEEAAVDLGATPWQSFRTVLVPVILPGLIGVAMLGFTLSYDELARSSLTMGRENTLPMEIWALINAATSPVLFALGSVTTAASFMVMGACIGAITLIMRRRAGSSRRKAV